MTNTLNEGKKLTTIMINKFIKAKEYDKRVAIIPSAEKYKVATLLFKSTCKKAGGHLLSQKKYEEAMIVINKARSKDVKDNGIFHLFISAVSKFFDTNVNEFSKK